MRDFPGILPFLNYARLKNELSKIPNTVKSGIWPGAMHDA